MGEHNAMGDAQAEAGTGYLLLYRRASIEPIKNAGFLVRWYTLAVVRNLNSDGTVHLLDPNIDRGSQWRILDSIIENLLEGKLYQSPVESHKRQLPLADQFERSIFGFALHGSNHPTNSFA